LSLAIWWRCLSVYDAVHDESVGQAEASWRASIA
jgi:hypothetical protein